MTTILFPFTDEMWHAGTHCLPHCYLQQCYLQLPLVAMLITFHREL